MAAWESRLELENDNLWAALAYAREAPDPALAMRLGTLGWYFAVAERVSEGRRFLELALSATGEDAPVELRVELLAGLCYLATEELDVDAALAAATALALAAAGAQGELGLAQLTLALALAKSGDEERRPMAQDALRTLEAAGDDWGSRRAASSARRARRARATLHRRRHGGGDPPSRRRDRLRRVSCPGAAARGMGRGATAGRRRRGGGVPARARARGRVGFGDHAAFALAGLGANALASRDLRGAEELERQALAAAEAAQASWVAAHARVQLGRIAAASGDAGGAERLYRQVLEWSQAQRPHQARESLFLALAGSPATAALLGLAELAEAHGDTARSRRAARVAPASRST